MFETQNDPLSVADFIAKINVSLLSYRGRVQGEVTSVTKNHPTTIFFTIKDAEADAVLDCVIFKFNYTNCGVDIEVGDELIITGAPEIYAPRGKFSFKAQTVEYAGEGALKKSYEELKKKLTEEGLLAESRKRPLPQFPRKIGVITSTRSGVVIQDFSSNLGRYGFQVTVVDSRVEGKDAIHEILASLKTLEKEDIEVLVIMRGGGSWESLQPFNTESVVRAVANFKCPVLTGIGHDVDVTLTQLVADVGGSTPTAVAEALNESWDTLTNAIESSEAIIRGRFERYLLETRNLIEGRGNRITRSYENQLSTATDSLNHQSTKTFAFFVDLERKITRASTALQSVMGRLKASIQERARTVHMSSLSTLRFSRKIVRDSETLLSESMSAISGGQKDIMHITGNALINIEKNIQRLNPERNLKLGYSLSYVNGNLVRSTKDVSVGDMTEIHLSDGTFTSEVKEVE